MPVDEALPIAKQIAEALRSRARARDHRIAIPSNPPTSKRGPMARVERRVTCDRGRDRSRTEDVPGMGRLDDVSPDGKTLLVSRRRLDRPCSRFSWTMRRKNPNLWSRPGDDFSRPFFARRPVDRLYGLIPWQRRRGIYSGGGTYVQPYPGPGFRKQVASRGNYLLWRKDGREIVYLDDYQGRNPPGRIPSPLLERSSGGYCDAAVPARVPATTFGDLNFLAVSRDGSRF